MQTSFVILIRIMVFNVTFNNIFLISRGSDLLVEETGVPGITVCGTVEHLKYMTKCVSLSIMYLPIK
jgi:hypothetical protein